MALLTLLSAIPILALLKTNALAAGGAETVKQVNKTLVTLPFYGVFDHLAYSYEDGIVTLYGQVVRPTTKSAAERSVARLRGVEQVINRIEILPLSSFNDQIRLATFRAIYRQPGLDRLAIQAVPPIHIIVNRGHVTLEGLVPSSGDATRAYLAASSVPQVFSVTNHL